MHDTGIKKKQLLTRSQERLVHRALIYPRLGRLPVLHRRQPHDRHLGVKLLGITLPE